MRGILMILGIVIHSAQIFSPEAVLKIVNPDTSILMKYLVDSIHLFRMPAFFVVSGFFCFMTLQKHGIKIFLKIRLIRIAIPLIACIFTLNIAMHYWTVATGWSEQTLESFFTSGRYINHLWFLVDLIYFFLITSIIHYFLDAKSALKKLFSLTLFKSIPLSSVLILLPFYTIFIMALNKIGIPIYVQKFGLFSPYSILYNYAFFIFGYFLYANRDLYRSFISINPLLNIAIIAGSLIIFNSLKSSQISIYLVIAEYSYLLAQWCSVALCFYLFSKFMSKERKIVLNLSEASYTIYLFHFLILIVISDFFIKSRFNIMTSFFLINIIVLLITTYIHFNLIKKSDILRYLFNGK